MTIVRNVGLVHTRLSIVDTSPNGHQPASDDQGKWWLTYNGEIFNHVDLRQRLGNIGYVSESDTHTLIHALDRWGVDALPMLNGQFAFAALDLARDRLLLARDRFGIKPLYVAATTEGIWFASEPEALIAAGVRVEAHDNAWQSMLEGSCYGGTTTMLAPIQRVPAGAYLAIPLRQPDCVAQRWYSVADQVDPDRQRRLARQPREALVRELEDTLRSAVHDALMGDVAVGTFCSGGVDSSVIAALAAELQADLVAFGARYRGDPALDEGPAARRCASALGIELDMFDVTPERWRSGFAAATVSFGAPLANASAVTVAELAGNAKRRGVKVLLTGEGADELFAGYYELHRDLIDRFAPASHRLTRKLEPLVFGGMPRPYRRGRTRMPRSPVWSTLTTPADERTTVGVAYSEHPSPRRDLEQRLLRDLDYTLPHLLNRMDKNAMQMSIETRVPFLDPRVVDLALNLPLETRTGPWTKGILRDVARRLLPSRVAHRPKIYGLSLDAGAWIDEAARPSFLYAGTLADAMRLPHGELERVMHTARRSLRVRIWSAEVWCRSVIGRQSLSSIERDLWRSGP